MYRKLDECAERRRLFREDPDFKLWAKMMTALAFVPVVNVVRAFEALWVEVPQAYIAHFDPIFHYFLDYYIGIKPPGGRPRGDPRFPIQLW